MNTETKNKLSDKLKPLKKTWISLPVFFLALLIPDVLLRWTYNGVGLTRWNDPVPSALTLCWCLLLTGIAWLLPRIAKHIWLVALPLLNSVLMIVHSGMYSFFNRFFSFSSLIFTGDGADFFRPEYIFIRKIIFLGAIISVLLGVAAAVLAPKTRYSLVRVIVSLLLIAIPAVCIGRISTAIASEEQTISWDDFDNRAALYDNFTNTTECLLYAGLYQYTFRDFCFTTGVYDLFRGNGDVIAELDEYYAQKTPDPDNDMTGRFQGKNLILIQLEAIDTWMINETCMPTLTAIKEQSIDFVNHYAPMYLPAGTFNTENIVNTGLVSPFTGGTQTIYTRNSYPYSIATLFRDEGYRARSFHDGYAKVYNRDQVHRNWGYEKLYEGADFDFSELETDTDLMNAYDDMVTKDQPFFTFVITISGHGSYEGSYVSELYYDRFAELLPEGTDEMIIHAYAHAYETDLFLTDLLYQLVTDGYMENTVLGFYSDHYDYYVLDDELIMEQKQVDDTNLIQHTAFFLYSDDTEPRKVDKVTSSIDILPTIVNLFGLDTDGRYYVGNDAFSDAGGYVMFADGSWLDNDVYWNISDPVTDEVRERRSEIETRLQMSWDTMNANYFYYSGKE